MEKIDINQYLPAAIVWATNILLAIVILLIGAIVFLKKANDKIDEKKIIMKIMGGLICIVVAGSILLEVDYIV